MITTTMVMILKSLPKHDERKCDGYDDGDDDDDDDKCGSDKY